MTIFQIIEKLDFLKISRLLANALLDRRTPAISKFIRIDVLAF